MVLLLSLICFLLDQMFDNVQQDQMCESQTLDKTKCLTRSTVHRNHLQFMSFVINFIRNSYHLQFMQFQGFPIPCIGNSFHLQFISFAINLQATSFATQMLLLELLPPVFTTAFAVVTMMAAAGAATAPAAASELQMR